MTLRHAVLHVPTGGRFNTGVVTWLYVLACTNEYVPMADALSDAEITCSACIDVLHAEAVVRAVKGLPLHRWDWEQLQRIPRSQR